MELEHHQLDLRYEGLRVRRPDKERRLVASLSAEGQQIPIVVVAGEQEGRYVVVDGYKRVRALKRLGQDTVVATQWQMGEPEALLLSRAMRSSEAESALEQGWLLKELHSSFAISQEELARRFDRSPSWVSRRLALATELPGSVQELVRRGRIGAHAAAKHLVPMARAKPRDCETLAGAIAPLGLSTREVGEVYRVWRDGEPKLRKRLLAAPHLFVKTRREMEREPPTISTDTMLRDLDVAGVLVRGLRRQYRECPVDMTADEYDSLQRCLTQTTRDLEQLARTLADHAPRQDGTQEESLSDEKERAPNEEEQAVADHRAEDDDSGASPQGGRCETDRQGSGYLPDHGEEGDPGGLERGPAHSPGGEGGELEGRDPAAAPLLQGQPAAGPRGAGGAGGRPVLPGADRLLPAARDRTEAEEGLRGVPLRPGGGGPARHLAPPGAGRRHPAAGPERGHGGLLLEDDLLPGLPVL